MTDPNDPNLPPWEQPGAVRRDCEPHRGELLLRVIQVVALLSVLSLCLFPATITLPLALTVRLLARRDLAEMKAGRMNPEGFRQTREAYSVALTAIWAGCAYLVLSVIWLAWALNRN